MLARTQAALYESIDLELSWSEDQLPQVLRTKHVHALHPYLGKFIPQLVEVFLRRYFKPGDLIFDPFAGSGTTLVEANAFGADAVGTDISAFNCLLASVKTRGYAVAELELALRTVLEDARQNGSTAANPSPWLQQWIAPQALDELLAYRERLETLPPIHADVARVILSRAARSARLTTHFDLDFPRKPITAPYYCYKHKRTCRPVETAAKFLSRYTTDTCRRIRAFGGVRTKAAVTVLHGDTRDVRLDRPAAGVITSPPYPGLIDYHEQHRYAYELLGLDDRRDKEIGAAATGRRKTALTQYVEAMSAAFDNVTAQLERDAWVLIVVNDSHGLYPAILENAGLAEVDRVTRHVNRRTGRRAGEFFEDVLICRAV